MSNTYAKYCPNVFLAKCTQPHNKGDIIPVTTKYGKDNDSIVFNLIFMRDGFYYYSIVREDGFNVQEWAKRKAEKYQQSAINASNRSSAYYQASHEGRDFLALGEPIKIGHHSEKRHRALIERNNARMDNCIKESAKVETYEHKAARWANKTETINLSMPESIEYYEFKLEEARKHHAGLKDGTIERDHGMSLQYANKAVKDTQKNYDIATKLWGDIAEDIPPPPPQVETVENNKTLFADSNESLILDNTNLDNNESIQLLTPLPSNKITPRYWQQKAINDVENAITHGKNRLLISAPTGSGKAYLLMFIIKRLLRGGNIRILLLVDRIKLVDQLCESAKIFNFDYNKIQGSIRDYNNDRLLTIASIQTYFNNPVATEYDVIIQDECHSQYSALTEYLQNHKGAAIGCTATPYSAGLMDIYTHLIETQTAAELTADKVLTPLRPFEMREIDMVGAKIVAGEWAASDVHKRSAKIYGDVVREFRCSHVYDKQGIVFCANIAHCNDVAKRFIRANVTCAVYSSMQSLKERQEILAKFDNNEIQLLISVATLSKGFDRPQIEVILDLRPLRKSLNEYIQMIGRGIRANKGKNECVLLDFSGNWDRFKDKVLLAHNHGSSSLLDVINANVSAKQLKRNSKRLNTVRTQSITNNPLTELTNGVQLVESEFTASNDNNLFVPPPSRKIGILKTIFNFLRK